MTNFHTKLISYIARAVLSTGAALIKIQKGDLNNERCTIANRISEKKYKNPIKKALMNSNQINWPQPEQISSISRNSKTLKTIKSIFYNSGLVMSLLYLLLEFVIRPILDVQYEQRNSLTAAALLKLRRIVANLQKWITTTPVAVIGFNETANTIERCTQTSEDSIISKYLPESTWESINDKLEDINIHLEIFNGVCDRPSQSRDNLIFQSQLIVDQLSSADSEGSTDREQAQEISYKITENIRDIKGWFVNGRIP